MTLLHLLKRPRNNPLRAKSPLSRILTVPFVLLTVGTTGLVGYLCIRNGQQAIADLAHQLMAETGDRVNLYLTDYLKTPHVINRLNANAVRLNQIDITDSESLKRHFVQQIQVFDSVSRIHFSNPQGGYLSTGNDDRGLSVATTRNFVSGTLQVHSVDSQGNRRKLLVERPGYDSRQRPFYQEAIKAGQPLWTPIYVYVPTSRGLGISASYPLYNQQIQGQPRQLQGVLSSDLTLSAISQFLAKLRVGTNGTVFIVDRSGLLVASSTPEKPFFTSANSNQTERLKAIESQETSIRSASQYLATQFGDLNQIKNPTQLQFDIEGQRQFLQVMPFQDESGLDWLIAITVPESSFMERIHSNTQDTLILSGAALIGSILLGLWLAHWIARPIRQLSRASDSLTAGKWQKPLKEDSPIAEIQVLVHALNQNAAQLQQSFDRIKTALAESEEKFTTIFRISPEPITIANLNDGCLVEVNESTIQFFGYSREEITGNTALQLNLWQHPEQREQYRALLAQQGSVRNLEVQVRLKSGEIKTVLLSAEVCNLEGQDRIIVTHRDITDRKATELALQQSEARYRAIVEDQTELVCRSLPDTTVLFVNDACCRYFGVNREDFTGKSYWQFIYEPDRVEVEQVIASLSIDQPIITSENRWVVNGEVRWMQWTDRLLFDEQENPTEIQSVGRDITHLKEAEEALRHSEERNQAILSAMPDLMTLISAEGIYRDIVRSNLLIDLIPLDVNPIGKHLTEVVPPEIAASKLRLIQQTLATGEMQTLEQRIWLDNRWQYEEVRAVPCGCDAALVMIRDITDRKQIEAALRQSEERNRAILSAIPDLMTLVSAEGIYLSAIRSNALIDLVPSTENPVGRHLTEMLPEEVAQRQLRMIKRALATGEVQREEQRIWFEDRWQYEELRVAPCGRDAALVMIRDITDRKQAELSLIESRDLREAIFNASADAIFLLELPPVLRILDCNQRAVELFEVEAKAALIGLEGNALKKHPLTRADLEDIALVMQQGGLWNREIEYVTRTGKIFWGSLAIKQIQVADRSMWLVRVTDVSPQKRIEEALRQSEQLFRGAFETSAFGISIRSPEGKYLRVNQALCRMLGYTESELLQASYRDITHPDDLAINLENTIQRLVAGEISYYHIEKRFIHKQGYVVWGLVSISLVRDLQNQPLYFVAQVQDITDRKQAQEALRQSEARFQKIAAASPAQIYILVCDSNGSNLRFEYVNSGVREIQELEPEQLLQDATLTYFQVHPDDRAVYNEVTYRSFKTLEPFSHQWRVITPSGKLKWVQANSRPERRDNGDIAWYGVLLDITERKRVEDERKQAEIALQESEARFQEIAQTISQIFFVLDLTTNQYLYISPSYERLWGYSPESLYQDPRSWLDRVHPEDLEYVMSGFNSFPDDNRNLQEYRMIAADGKIHWIRAESWIVRDENGNPIREVGLADDITDRKQAEEALRQSEATLRRAQQVAHVGSWQVEVQTGKVTWTEESFHIMGWDISQPEPSLPQFYELIHPDDRNLLVQQVESVIAHQIPYKVEFRVIHPDGSLRYVEARGDAVINEEGRTTYMIGTNLDITERKQAEEALRNSEATKNQILKAIPDLILWMNSGGTCIDLIDGNSVTNLYNKSEAVGKNLYEILPFDLAQARMNAIQQALNTGEVQIYEQQVVLQSGTSYEEVRVIGVGDDRVLVIVRNVTDRKRAEAALLDSETRFRRAFSDAPIGMALIGLDDRWIKVNPMLCDMLDFTESELLSRTASSLVHPEDWNKLQKCIQQVLSSENRNAQVELRYCCQQGQIIWGLMSLSLVRDGQGKPLYYVAQIQDITERRAIDRMKNEFISIVSHELRTPLTAIRGFLGLLDTGIYDKKPEKAKHMIGQALSNSDRLVRLVNDILDLERLSSGKIQLIKEACGAEELMQRAVTGVQSLADQANIQLIIVPTVAEAWADSDCIIQTLTNLLSNAIKFSPPNSAITLSVQARTDSVLFSVQDQGRGIPADKLETIFGRFQQVDVSDSRQKGGTGLGLAICQSIVQQHGGSIWAESIPGNGSTFYFTLPLMSGGEQ
ncbi:PAS domain S-box protein [Leptolyngbya ohadii]|uniref:PAS domain S-box protein n=1 Tax=Leptolyngbya ohadii TaxID=1962290 RepID=UPI000B5A0383|nr:PAS domain S-box protein [Leptolyngbya ohadii]